jgi:hypothetical protein
MHDGAYSFVAQFLMTVPVPARVLEAGSLNINGSVRPICAALGTTVYHGIDLVAGDGVDEVSDAATYSTHAPFDLVLCCEVLEHAANADAIVANLVMQTARGGYVVMTCAGDGRGPHSAVDGGVLRPGEFYRNVSRDEMHDWLADAGAEDIDIQSRPDRGDLYATARRPA